nr:peptidyl-prolyl cis-trans isomerase [Vicinamibacterales bacterium]
FTANEPILAFGASQQVSNSLFALADGAVSTALPVGRGFIVAVVSGKLAASIPPLDEVKDRVRNDVLRQKAGALAADKMRSAEAAIKAAADFAAAAKKAGFEAKTSELVARGAALPDVGVNAAVERAAFSLPAGATSDTIAGPDGATIVKVLERKEVAPAEVAASRESVRQELIDARRSEFFSAYMTKARQRMKIEYNRRVIDQIIG